MAKSKNNLDISVLIATYNRAEILRQTLESMTRLDRDVLSVEFVIVDNNNVDNSKEVIKSFADKLPIRYLFESRPGKNCALNRALDEVRLGKIVVFCDDDIVPQENWLKVIVAACKRWPNYGVFGGRIYMIWPEIAIPSWARCRSVQEWGFSRSDNFGELECPYPLGAHPPGSNFWVRREIFSDGRRYKESIGPCPDSYFPMGSEASFLLQLAANGYYAMYIPDAVIGHRVQPNLLSVPAIWKRAYRFGRGSPHLRGLPRAVLLNKHPILWWLVRVGALAKAIMRCGLAITFLSRDQRVIESAHAIKSIASNVESLRIASKIEAEKILQKGHRN